MPTPSPRLRPRRHKPRVTTKFARFYNPANTSRRQGAFLKGGPKSAGIADRAKLGNAVSHLLPSPEGTKQPLPWRARRGFVLRPRAQPATAPTGTRMGPGPPPVPRAEPGIGERTLVRDVSLVYFPTILRAQARKRSTPRPGPRMLLQRAGPGPARVLHRARATFRLIHSRI